MHGAGRRRHGSAWRPAVHGTAPKRVFAATEGHCNRGARAAGQGALHGSHPCRAPNRGASSPARRTFPARALDEPLRAVWRPLPSPPPCRARARIGQPLACSSSTDVRLPAPRPRMPAMCTVHRKPGSRDSPPRRRIERGSWQACSALGRRIPGPRGPRRAHAGGIGWGAGCARSDGSAASQGAGLAASHTPPAPRLPAAHRKRRAHSSSRRAYKLL